MSNQIYRIKYLGGVEKLMPVCAEHARVERVSELETFEPTDQESNELCALCMVDNGEAITRLLLSGYDFQIDLTVGLFSIKLFDGHGKMAGWVAQKESLLHAAKSVLENKLDA